MAHQCCDKIPAAKIVLPFPWNASVNRGDGKISQKLVLLMAVSALAIALPVAVLSQPCRVGELHVETEIKHTTNRPSLQAELQP